MKRESNRKIRRVGVEGPINQIYPRVIPKYCARPLIVLAARHTSCQYRVVWRGTWSHTLLARETNRDPDWGATPTQTACQPSVNSRDVSRTRFKCRELSA